MNGCCSWSEVFKGVSFFGRSCMFPVRPTTGLNGLLFLTGLVSKPVQRFYVLKKRCQLKQWLSGFCFLDGSGLHRSSVSNKTIIAQTLF